MFKTKKTKATVKSSPTASSVGDQQLSTPAYRKRVVIAVDFGSTHCGIAYSLVNFTGAPDPTDPNFDYNTILEKPDVLAKVYEGKFEKQPTSALFDSETEELQSFGFNASEEYLDIVAEEDYDQMENKLYFEGRDIKMRLWDKAVPFEKIEVRSQDGRGKMKLTSIVAGILKYLKEEALALASKGLDLGENFSADSTGKSNALSGMKATDALWVLTVPSIWQEADKQFMRKAAFEAGMIPSQESPDLILALEPECAIIAACESANGFKEKDQVLTLDCGGGTVDICAVEILKPKVDGKKVALRLKHLIEPCGGNWGSTHIDFNFLAFLEIFLKDARLDKLRRADPACIIEAMKDFEALKTSVTYNQYRSQKGVRIFNFDNIVRAINKDNEERSNWNIFYGPDDKAKTEKNPITLKDILDEFNTRLLIIKSQKGDDISCLEGLRLVGGDKSTSLELPMTLLHSLFESVISRIAQEVSDKIDIIANQGNKINKVLLVGGFAECEILQREIKSRIKVKVLVPKHPATVVQKGAVQYGFDPKIVSTRKARQTIGVKVTMSVKDLRQINPGFFKDLSPDVLTQHVEGGIIKDVFNVFIRKGQEINTTELITRRYNAKKNNGKMKFDIFATSAETPRFTTDQGCEKLATLTIPIESPADSKTPPVVEYRMSFASTEILVKAKNITTGETKELMLMYNNTFEDATDDTDSIVSVPVKELKPWGVAFDLAYLNDRELEKQGGVSEML